MKKTNIVLIGYRGTGKSTIAKLLSRRVISIDEEIIRTAGKSIPEIVAESGWDAFRDRESAEVEKAAKESGVVIDAGGGAVLRPKNIEALRATGTCFWLTASVETIAARIAGDSNRPSLTGKNIADEIAEVLAEREPHYRGAADHIISTEGRSPSEVADEILSFS